MLPRVLQEMEAAGETVSLDELSRRLDIEPGALEGMLQFLVRKGRILEDAGTDDGLSDCAAGGCKGSCPGPNDCPFIAKMPRTYTYSHRPE
jgi:hypothetical protein